MHYTLIRMSVHTRAVQRRALISQINYNQSIMWIPHWCAKSYKQISIEYGQFAILARVSTQKVFMFGDVDTVLSNLMTFAVCT